MPTKPPVILGNYELESPVARGGMAEIWRARDPRTGEPVAIKRVLVEEGQLSEEQRVRLLREAALLRDLQHDNIVRYLDVGVDEDDGQPFLVLEWLEGEDLASRQQRSPLTLHQALDVVGQCLSGLRACHERGLVHRDIKPGNLVLVGEAERPTVKVVDFGVALAEGQMTRLTQAGAVVGTLHYLSPEQARGDAVDPRTDLYAVGVMLYELATGRLPFLAQQPAAVLLKIVTETPPRPRQLRAELPPLLEAVILRAMQRSPEDRFPSAQEMAAALDRVQRGSLPFAPTAPTAPAPPPSSTERRLVTMLCAQPVAPGPAIAAAVIAAVEQSGGIVQRLLGGQVVGLYGVDQTAGDEALRAVRAGIAVLDRVGAQARLLAATLHVDVGEELQLDAAELDETVASVPDQSPGVLVADSPTLALLGDQVEVDQTDHNVVVGLVDRPTTRRLVLGVETPTVGRETELATLHAVFARVAANEEPEALLVLGPAGIGKSRLCRDLLHALRPRCALTLDARAESTKAKTPYGLLADAVTRPAGIHLGLDPADRQRALRAFVARLMGEQQDRDEVAAFVGEAIGVPFAETPALRVARTEPKVMSQRVARSFEALLQAAGRSGPVVLFLEDLHWADQESLRLCTQLVERLGQIPFLLLANARPQLLERHPEAFSGETATRLELPPLRQRPLRRLLGAMLPDLPADLEQLIIGGCAGNPYFAEELVSWMVTRQVLVEGASGWEVQGDPTAIELPVGVEGAIQGRLDTLAPRHKELLKAAAVFGEVFWDEGCEALGIANAAAGLKQLEQAEFVAPRGDSRIPGAREWIFRHALLHQVAYQMLPGDRRRLLHPLAAGWLERMGETDAALLAHHYEQGGDERRAADCYGRAGDKALSDGDLERAVAFFERSLQPPLEGQARVDRMMGLARSQIHLGRYDQAWSTLDALDPLVGQVDGGSCEPEVALMRGRILLGSGRYNEAEAILDRASAMLGDPVDERAADLLFQVRHTLFWVIWVQGRYGDAGPIAELLHQEALRSNRPDQLCSAKLCVAYWNKVAGDLSAAISLTREAVEHAREIGHPFREVDSLTLLATTQELVGLYDQALQTLAEARPLALRLKTVHSQAGIEASLGRVCLSLNKNEEALEHYRAAMDKAETLGDERSLAIAIAGEARALCRRRAEGDLALAAQEARRAVELAVDRAPPVEAKARLILAEAHLAQGAADEALEQAMAAVAVLDALGMQERYEVEILLAAHDALRQAGQEQEARQMLERAGQTLARRAQQITDDAIRASFTVRVAHHQRVTRLLQTPNGNG